MHAQAMRSQPEREDVRFQSALLGLVLCEHPTELTAEDLRRELGDPDATDRAIDELVVVGLLRRAEEAVIPTRAALRFDLLEAK